MMHAEILKLAAELSQRGEPFVLITVVGREAPSSARLGDCALVTPGGAFHGWLGGACTQPVAVREAKKALSQGEPRLIALSPDGAGGARPGVTRLPMTCHSGGSVDLFVQPVLPTPRLLVYGVSPTAQALARMAKVMGYTVEAIDPEADRATFPEADWVVTDLRSPDSQQRARRERARLFAVVATLGESDEEAIRAAATLDPVYLGVVASPRRFEQLRKGLISDGARQDIIDRISSPAGLDIGAVAPAEIAVSILAEIVERSRGASSSAEPEREDAHEEVIDPICGMTVDPATSRHSAEFRDRVYYFCCGGCRDRFIAGPERFVTSEAEGRE